MSTWQNYKQKLWIVDKIYNWQDGQSIKKTGGQNDRQKKWSAEKMTNWLVENQLTKLWIDIKVKKIMNWYDKSWQNDR